MNYAIYPCKVMRITQNYNGKTSHKPHNTGTPEDYPIDEGGSDSGKEHFYCPCDEMKISRIYGVGTKGTNTLWLESTKKADFADGTRDYLTVMITHPDDGDLKGFKVGDVFKRKEKITREGKDGATANHLHISAGKGKMKNNGWVRNSKGKWVLITTSAAARPEDIFYIDPDFTRIISSGSIAFKNLPHIYTAGDYRVSVTALNVRSGAGTKYKKVSSLAKGEVVRIDKVRDNWGRFAYRRWICLDYCIFM